MQQLLGRDAAIALSRRSKQPGWGSQAKRLDFSTYKASISFILY